MKLFEFEAKNVFSKYGIPVPKGAVVSSAADVKEIASPVAVKAQVLVGGRGKAGGIKFATNPGEAKKAVGDIIGMSIKGYKVRQALIEEKLDVGKEIYISFMIDRAARAPLLMASTMGGVDIESVPDKDILKIHIPPLIGMQPFIIRELRRKLGLEKALADQVADIAQRMFKMFKAEDAELVEINPLVITKDGRVVAGDAKVTIDDNAMYRHKEYARVEQDLTPLEKEAKDKGIAFIQLDGDIGVIANGAGLTMATLDTLNKKGGKGGTFLDLGGTDDPEKVKEAFELLMKANPKVILMNIFGGITKCDTVAIGVKEALEAQPAKVPVVARIRGLHEEEAKKILKDAGMVPVDTMEEAAEEAVRLRGK